MTRTDRLAVEALNDRVADLRRRYLKPRPRLTVSQSAARSRVIPPPAFLSGRWLNSNAPHLVEVMDQLSRPEIHEVAYMGASQTGKTEILLNAMLHYALNDPCDMLLVQPTIDGAERFSKRRLAPMIEHTPDLKQLFAPARSRDSGNTLLLKEFSGGSIRLSGANSPQSLASDPIKFVSLDERARHPKSAGTEGDVGAIVKVRMTSFPDWKLLEVSSPTDEECLMNASYIEGDQRVREVSCVYCAHWFVISWGDVRYERNADEQLVRASVHVACPACGGRHDERHKWALMQGARWRATAIPKRPEKVSFRANVLISLLYPWASVVQDWLNAQGDPERRRSFVNTRLAETYRSDIGVLSPTALEARAERDATYPPVRVTDSGREITVVPRAVGLLTAGVDVQDDRLEIIVRGWGLSEESWLVERHIIEGDTDLPAAHAESPWRALDRYRRTRWPHESGGTMGIAAMGIDSGDRQEKVFEFTHTRWRDRVMATRGSSNNRAPAVPRRASRNNRRRVRQFFIGTVAAKDQVLGRLKYEVPGPGYYHLNRFCDRDYAEQILSNNRVRDTRTGRVRYLCPKDKRDEVLDCEVIAWVVLRIVCATDADLAARVRRRAGELPPVAVDADAPPPEDEGDDDAPPATPSDPPTDPTTEPPRPRARPPRRVRRSGYFSGMR
jgi:phage terminase large subunit GpA-like protein